MLTLFTRYIFWEQGAHDDLWWCLSVWFSTAARRQRMSWVNGAWSRRNSWALQWSHLQNCLKNAKVRETEILSMESTSETELILVWNTTTILQRCYWLLSHKTTPPKWWTAMSGCFISTAFPFAFLFTVWHNTWVVVYKAYQTQVLKLSQWWCSFNLMSRGSSHLSETGEKTSVSLLLFTKEFALQVLCIGLWIWH